MVREGCVSARHVVLEFIPSVHDATSLNMSTGLTPSLTLPFLSPFQVGEVIKGWDLGIVGCEVGDRVSVKAWGVRH